MPSTMHHHIWAPHLVAGTVRPCDDNLIANGNAAGRYRRALAPLFPLALSARLFVRSMHAIHESICRPHRGELAMAFLLLLSTAIFLPAAENPGKGQAKADSSYDERLGPGFEKRPRPTLGSEQAPVVVIEFASYTCAHCRLFHQRIFPALKEQYIATGKVQWIMVPSSADSADEYSRIFALGRCIDRQGKFWQTLDSLFALSKRPPSMLEELIGEDPAIDSSALASCVRERDTQKIVSTDFRELEQLQVKQTPTFIIRRLNANGSRTESRIPGLPTLEYFQRVLDHFLKAP
jgi:protein-disulfide isomerase